MLPKFVGKTKKEGETVSEQEKKAGPKQKKSNGKVDGTFVFFPTNLLQSFCSPFLTTIGFFITNLIAFFQSLIVKKSNNFWKKYVFAEIIVY
jgi:hypothetical protein